MFSIKRSINFLAATNAFELSQLNWIDQKNVVVLRLIEVFEVNFRISMTSEVLDPLAPMQSGKENERSVSFIRKFRFLFANSNTLTTNSPQSLISFSNTFLMTFTLVVPNFFIFFFILKI